MFGPLAPASATALADAVALLAGQLLGLIGGRPAGPAPDDRDVGELRARRAVWRVMRAYEEVAEGRSLDSLIAEARQLAPTAEQVSKAFQLWADVIDSLMEDAERRYGERASGEFKKRRVKGALLRWFRKADVDLGPVPEPLQPIIFEQLVDWSIESVYAVVVPNDLWTAAQAAAAAKRPSPLRRLATWIFDRVLMGGVLLRLLTRAMWNGVLNRYPLPAELEPAVAAAADRTQYIDDVVLAQAKQLGGYLATHQRDVAAVWNLVAAAVQEAEGFLSADGATKKGYARGVIFEALSRAGLGGLADGLGHGLIAWLVDFGIDASVALFHKHDRFEHRSHLRSPQPSRAAPRAYGTAPRTARRPVAAPVARPMAAPVARPMAAPVARPARGLVGTPGLGPALGPLVDLHMQVGTLGSQILMDHLLLAGDAFAASLEARSAQPPRHRQF